MRNNHTLLIISDDHALVEQVHLAVCDDCHLVQMSDRATALAAWPYPDLVILESTDTADDLEAECRAFAADRRSQDVPLVALVEPDDAHIGAAFGAGAVDCFIKPLQPALVCWRVKRHLERGDDSRATQDALRKSQERLQLALEAAGIGIWDWNMVTGEAYFSDSWIQMLGYELDEVEPNFDAWRAIIHPDDLPAIEAAIQAHIDDGVPYEVEHRLRTKRGDWLWVLTRGKVVRRDDGGRPLRMAGTHRDVNETKLMQEALRESEERHRIISNTISDYAYSYQVRDDYSLSKDWSTQAFYDITGYTTEEMDGDGWSRIIHPDDMSIAEKRFERLLQGQVDVTEFRIITKSGEVRWLRDHGYPVVDTKTGQVIRIYGAAQDITQRRRDEETLRRQAAELAARNEELDAFAYSVAHDLKNPIASMMGFASLVQNYYDRMSDEKIKEYLSLIMEGGYKLKSIINALLMLAGVSKMQQAELSPLDMEIIVEDAKKRLVSMIEETQARIVSPPEWPIAQGYGPWVEEVWMNYISNALKYGGEPPELELGADTQTNGMVRFWVRDNGQGLTDDEQERVFTPFTRLNKVQVEGHGLGLSVVERIVKKLGGQVGVESSVGHGSVFSFTLPKAP